MPKKPFLSFFVVIALLALAVSACGPVAPAQPAQPEDSPTITVTGSGNVTRKPDVAYVFTSVSTQAAVAADAVSANNLSTEALIAAMKAAGISEADLSTSNFSIWQSYNYDPMTGMPGDTFYQVDNTVNLTVRDLAQLGAVLDNAVNAGASTISGISFDLEDKSDAAREARQLAVEAAMAQAQELAAAAGVELGDLQSISYSSNDYAPVYPYARAVGSGGGDAASVTPIAPGDITVSASVQLVFEIK